MSKEIKLTRGYVTVVDDADFEWLSGWKWHVFIRFGLVYACRQYCHPTLKNKRGHKKQISISMARLIMGEPKGMNVDHINGNSLDNRRANLRICTHQQNLWNSHRRLGLYKGVYEGPGSKKWRANIVVNKKSKHLGMYNSPQDAARAYDKAAMELFGEYACTNFPKKWYKAEKSA